MQIYASYTSLTGLARYEFGLIRARAKTPSYNSSLRFDAQPLCDGSQHESYMLTLMYYLSQQFGFQK